MQAPDFERFKAVMAGMGKLYERDIDRVLMDAYWMALRDWQLDDFEQAAGHLMASAKFMPRPADFNDLRKAQRPVAAEAWLIARQACKTAWTPQGFTGRGTCGDTLIDKAVQSIGGYGAIANHDTEKMHFLEKRFIEAFESIQDANDVREALPMLGGGFGLAAIQQRREQRKIEKEPEPV